MAMAMAMSLNDEYDDFKESVENATERLQQFEFLNSLNENNIGKSEVEFYNRKIDFIEYGIRHAWDQSFMIVETWRKMVENGPYSLNDLKILDGKVTKYKLTVDGLWKKYDEIRKVLRKLRAEQLKNTAEKK